MTDLLLVEDDPVLARTLTLGLGAHGYRVDSVGTGAEAIERARSGTPAVLVLDLGLPDVDGIDVVHAVRRSSSVPIVVLSARDGHESKVAALDAGADDYVTKPFDMGELLARLRAALRRARPSATGTVVRTGDLVIDRRARRVERAGALVHLTPTEWNLLDMLVRSPGSLVTQRDILHEVWGTQYSDETNYLRVYMAQLRRKLEERPSQPRHLLTDPGVGYRFEP